MSSRAPAGVSATRYSSGLISLATPIFIAGAQPYLCSTFGIPASHTRTDFRVTLKAVGGTRPTPDDTFGGVTSWLDVRPSLARRGRTTVGFGRGRSRPLGGVSTWPESP